MTAAHAGGIRVLAISGSLRAASANRSMVEAARLVAPPGVEVAIWEGLGGLPHFNPDLDREGMTPPPAVAALRAEVARSHGLLISSPEYAHGVPGSLKNALDWLVSDVHVPGIRVGLVNASLGSTHAQASLVEILTTMSAEVVPGATVRIALADRAMDAGRIAADAMLGGALRGALGALVESSRRSARDASRPS